MKYTTSFRNSVLKKILPPSNRSVTSVSKETGVAVVTINNWLARLKEGKMSLDEDDENPSSMRNSREKLDLLIEYQTVSEENQGECLRHHGLHSEHLPLFRQESNEQFSAGEKTWMWDITWLKTDVRGIYYYAYVIEDLYDRSSGWMPPPPAFFVKKSVYEKYGLFRLDCGINAGYELMLRFLGVF